MVSSAAQEKDQPAGSFLLLLGILLLGFLLHLPNLGLQEIHLEEGRRAIPAREMIASGDWVLPTIWGVPYLNKPPLYSWSVALVGHLRGGRVDEVTVRFPSVLASIACALLLMRWGRRRVGNRAGILAAITFYLGLQGLAKGNLGETDLLFSAWILAAITFLDEGWGGSKRWFFASGVCLGAALLTKGPLALVFYLAAQLALLSTAGKPRGHWIGGPLIGWICALGTAGIWGLLLILHPGGESALATWKEELFRSGGSGEYLAHRYDFIIGVLGGFLPASVILVLTASSRLRKRWREDPLVVQCLFTALLPLAFLFLWPGVQPRYALPALPLLSLAAARILDLLLTSGDRAAENRIGIFSQSLRIVIVIAAGIFAFDLVASDLLRSSFNLPVIDPLREVVAVLCLLAAAFLPLKGFQQKLMRSLVRLGLLLVAIRIVQLAVILPTRVERDGSPARAFAAEIEAIVPPGEALNIDIEEDWNWLVQIDREIRITAEGEDLPPGSWLLMGARIEDDSPQEPEPTTTLSGPLFFQGALPHEGNVVLMRVHGG